MRKLQYISELERSVTTLQVYMKLTTLALLSSINKPMLASMHDAQEFGTSVKCTRSI